MELKIIFLFLFVHCIHCDSAKSVSVRSKREPQRNEEADAFMKPKNHGQSKKYREREHFHETNINLNEPSNLDEDRNPVGKISNSKTGLNSQSDRNSRHGHNPPGQQKHQASNNSEENLKIQNGSNTHQKGPKGKFNENQRLSSPNREIESLFFPDQPLNQPNQGRGWSGNNNNSDQKKQSSNGSKRFENPVETTTQGRRRNPSDGSPKFEKLTELRPSAAPLQESNQAPNSKESLLDGNSCGLDVPRRIIGGTSTDIDEFPWLALLLYYNPTGQMSSDCSGVLISKRYVVTAAHCTHGPAITARSLKLRRVRLGEWDTSSEKDCQGQVCSAPVQEIEVEEIIPHQQYKPRSKSQVHDISLIRLLRDANYNQFVQPICLPFGEIGNKNYEGKKLMVSGWGRTSNARNSASSVKMKVDLPIVNWDKCSQFYQSFYGDLKITKSQFCAGGEEGKDSCQGDSGGPLMTISKTDSDLRWFLIGIVSSGPAACAVEDRPSLYTNVSQYTDWIIENIKN